MKKVLAIVLALTMVLALSVTAFADEEKSFDVGVIQQLEHPALDLATQGFVEKLTELMEADGYKVNIDVQNAQNETANCATIANQMVSDQVDLILANATSALQAAAAATDEIPILGTSITDYATALDVPAEEWTGATGRNISGTTDLADLQQQAAMLAELCPVEDYPNAGILYCSAEANSVFQATEVKAALEELGYEVEEYTFADSNEIASVVQNACDACDVLYIPTDNTAANATATIDNVALPAGVPIIAGEEGIMNGCGIATLSISYYNIGARAGEMAYDILVKGADVSTMAIEGAPQVKMAQAERCAELNITIPDDYEVVSAEDAEAAETEAE